MSMHALSTSARSGTSAGSGAEHKRWVGHKRWSRHKHEPEHTLRHRLKYRQGTSMGAGASAPPGRNSSAK